MLPETTEQQRQDALHVASLHTDGERLRLDLRDDVQYRHAVDTHTLAGQTPDTHPGLHQALAEAREHQIATGGPGPLDDPDPHGFSTGAVIAGVVNVKGQPAAAAEGFATVLGGASVLTAALVVIDRATGQQLAAGNSDQYGDGTYLGVATNTTSALPRTTNMLGGLQYTYQKSAGSPIVVERVQLAANQVVQPDPQVAQPVKRETVTRDPNIRIGLGRGTGSTTDVDYWFWQGSTSTSYAVPMVGTATFAAQVTVPPGPNVTPTAWLARAKGDPDGSGGVKPAPPAQIQNIKNALQASGAMLRWNLPAATGPQAPGNPINWGPLDWSSGEIVHVVVQFSVPLQGQLFPGFAAVQSVDGGRDVDPTDGIATIPALDFLYCCVAGDATVVLADGSEKRVDALQGGELLPAADGGDPVRVRATRLAPFDGVACKLVVGERELVLSPNHPVITRRGPVRADALVVGDEIRVADGYATLDAPVAPAPFQGLLCNPSLSHAGHDVDPERNQLLVNGIAVSDYELQVHESARTRLDPERIKGELDELFLPDYEGHRRRVAAA